jgi:hypothetical protein
MLKRRQDEQHRAPRQRSCQSGVDCRYQVVVLLGHASPADRAWAGRRAPAAPQGAGAGPPGRPWAGDSGFLPSAAPMNVRKRATDELMASLPGPSGQPPDR